MPKNKQRTKKPRPLFFPLLLLTFILGIGIFSAILGSTIILHVQTIADTSDDFSVISKIHDESIAVVQSIVNKDGLYKLVTVDKEHVGDTIYHIIQFDGNLSTEARIMLEQYNFSNTTLQINVINWAVALAAIFSSFIVLFLFYKRLMSDTPGRGYLQIITVFSAILIISAVILAYDINYIPH